MTNEKDRARLTRIAKQWTATLVGSRHVSNSEIATLAEMLEPLLVTVRRETEAIRDTKLIERDGFMCEAHPGLEFEHDPDCPGPGMPWVIEGREAVTQLCRAPVATRVDDGSVAQCAQAVLTALNVGDVQSGSPLHLKLREVMIAYRERAATASLVVAQDARALVEQFVNDTAPLRLYAVEVLVERITTYANQRYVEGLQRAAREVCDGCDNEERYSPAHRISGSTLWWHTGEGEHRCEAAAIRALLNEERRR